MKKFVFIILFSFFSNSAFSQDAYIGEIRMFAGNFAPTGWALCNGQLMAIAQNTALFSLLGTTYGGNGQTTFGLPDLRGRVPLGWGSGPGLTPRNLGEVGGVENVTLTVNQMPAHNHTIAAVTSEGNQNSPTNNLPADTKLLDKEYSDAAANTSMKASMVGVSGGNQPFSTMQPFTTVNFIICTQGIYPPRP